MAAAYVALYLDRTIFALPLVVLHDELYLISIEDAPLAVEEGTLVAEEIRAVDVARADESKALLVIPPKHNPDRHGSSAAVTPPPEAATSRAGL